MSKVAITQTKLDDLANAVAAKSGEDVPLTVDEMTTAVLGIEPKDLESKTVSITPTESAQSQTVEADAPHNGLDEVTVNVGAIPSDYVGTGVTRRTSSDMAVSNQTVTAPAGYYPASAAKSVATMTLPTATSGSASGTRKLTVAYRTGSSQRYINIPKGYNNAEGYYQISDVPNGTAGTPTASKGAVSNHSIDVTPSVTNTTGYITGGTNTGSAVSVSASELVSGTLSITQNDTGIDVTNYAAVDVAVSGGSPTLQTVTKSYTPSETAQSETITPGAGYDGIGEVDVSVGAISSTYVGTGIQRRDSTDLYASGATVNVPEGYYENAASKEVASGSATPAASISATGATLSTGANTITLSKSVSNTPQVSAGYISSGTEGNSTVSLTATVTTKAAATITPGTSNQTIASGTYLTGTQTISGDANLVAGNIKSGTSIFGVTGTYTGGGSSNWTLLGTKSLGTISTSSTTDTDTGQTIVVTGWNDYDMIVCECSVNTKTNGRHAASTKIAWMTASSNVTTKNGCTFATACWNCKLSSSGTATTRSSTTSYGVYAKAGTISGTNLTITIYQRYNSTQSGTINGAYTMRVYGVKIYDLIGG